MTAQFPFTWISNSRPFSLTRTNGLPSPPSHFSASTKQISGIFTVYFHEPAGTKASEDASQDVQGLGDLYRKDRIAIQCALFLDKEGSGQPESAPRSYPNMLREQVYRPYRCTPISTIRHAKTFLLSLHRCPLTCHRCSRTHQMVN